MCRLTVPLVGLALAASPASAAPLPATLLESWRNKEAWTTFFEKEELQAERLAHVPLDRWLLQEQLSRIKNEQQIELAILRLEQIRSAVDDTTRSADELARLYSAYYERLGPFTGSQGQDFLRKWDAVTGFIDPRKGELAKFNKTLTHLILALDGKRKVEPGLLSEVEHRLEEIRSQRYEIVTMVIPIRCGGILEVLVQIEKGQRELVERLRELHDRRIGGPLWDFRPRAK